MDLEVIQYHAYQGEWTFIITKSTGGWSAVCFKNKDAQIDMNMKIMTIAGWQPILNQTCPARYYVSENHAAKELQIPKNDS